jgi:hypothetical protein
VDPSFGNPARVWNLGVESQRYALIGLYPQDKLVLLYLLLGALAE